MRDSNGHFYIEPVWRPSLLPTPVWRNPTAPPQDTTDGRGQGGRVVFFAMGYVNSSGHEIMCTNHPADPKNIKEQPDAEMHQMASMEGLL